MKNLIYMFNTTAETLVSKISVTANIITLYMKGSKRDQIFEFAISDNIQQQAPCEGSFKSVNQKEAIHDYLHLDTADSNINHAHYQHCDAITPEVFSSFFDQLKSFQSDPVARQKLYETDSYKKVAGIIKFARQFSEDGVKNIDNLNPLQKHFNGQMYLASLLLKDFTTEIDTHTDYLCSKDIDTAKNEFIKFFEKNRNEILNHYEQIKKDLTWDDEFSELGKNSLLAFIYSAGYSSLQSTLSETLKAHGISAEKSRWIVHAVSMSMVAAFNSTWYPFLFAASTLTILHYLRNSNKMNCTDQAMQLTSSIVATLTSIAENCPTNIWGLLTLTSSLLVSMPTAYVSAKISGSLSQTFWNWCYKKPNLSVSSSNENSKDQSVELIHQPKKLN